MNDAPTILLSADLPETRRIYGPWTYSTENLRVHGFQTISMELLDAARSFGSFAERERATSSGRVFVPSFIVTDWTDYGRPTPEILAEKRARRAEHERQRVAWWASLTRTQRFHITNRRRRAQARTKINDIRANVALKIAPWLDDRDDW